MAKEKNKKTKKLLKIITWVIGILIIIALLFGIVQVLR